ncbi:hypothetical protein Aduo_009149 [Ancylostoma duodenale]
MRLLLYRKGATSFDDLKTINNRHYHTYVAAARAAGYMNDDSFYEVSMDEATGFNMPSELRNFFASLICFCEVANPRYLWEHFKKDLSEDSRIQGVQSQDDEALAFHDIAAKIALYTVALKDVSNVNYDTVSRAPNVVDYVYGTQTNWRGKLREAQRGPEDCLLLMLCRPLLRVVMETNASLWMVRVELGKSLSIILSMTY